MRRSSSRTPSPRSRVQSPPPGSTLPRSRGPSKWPLAIGAVTRVPCGTAPTFCAPTTATCNVINRRESTRPPPFALSVEGRPIGDRPPLSPFDPCVLGSRIAGRLGLNWRPASGLAPPDLGLIGSEPFRDRRMSDSAGGRVHALDRAAQPKSQFGHDEIL